MKIFKSLLFITQISAQKKVITKAKLRKWEKAVAARRTEKELEKSQKIEATKDPLGEIILPEIPPESDIEYELAETFDYSPNKLPEEQVPDYSAFWYGDISPEIDVEGIPVEYEMFNDIGLQRTMNEVGISADEFDEIVEKQFLDDIDERTIEKDKTKSSLSSRMSAQFEDGIKEEKSDSSLVKNLLRSKKKLSPKEKKELAEIRAERKKKKEAKEAKKKKAKTTTQEITTTEAGTTTTTTLSTTTSSTTTTQSTRRKRPKGRPTKKPLRTKKTTTSTTTTSTNSTATTTSTTTTTTTTSTTTTSSTTLTSTTSTTTTPKPLQSANHNRESFMLSKNEIPSSDDLFCWKCSAQNFEQCNKTGTAQKCPADQRTCAIELRKRDGRVVGVQMGCQSSWTCEANKKQNFIHPYPRLTQCRPEWIMPYSVCRQCCHSNWCNRGNDPLETPYWFKPVDRYEWEMIRD